MYNFVFLIALNFHSKNLNKKFITIISFIQFNYSIYQYLLHIVIEFIFAKIGFPPKLIIIII